MKRDEKFALCDRYKEMLQGTPGFVLVDYRGLTVDEITDLRTKLREVGARLQVVRNRIFGHAIGDEAFVDQVKTHLAGPTAVLIAEEDLIGAGKILVAFKKDHDVIELKAAVIEGEYIDEEQVQALHKMRSKTELLAAILGGIEAPARNLLTDFQGPARKLAGLLRAYEEKLGEAA